MAKRSKEQKFARLYNVLKGNRMIGFLLIPPLFPFGLIALLFRGIVTPRKTPGAFTCALLSALAIAGIPTSLTVVNQMANQYIEEANADFEQKQDHIDGKQGYIICRDDLLPDLDAFSSNFDTVFTYYEEMKALFDTGVETQLIWEKYHEFDEGGWNIDYSVLNDDSRYIIELETGDFSYRSPIDKEMHDIAADQEYGHHFSDLDRLETGNSVYYWQSIIEERLDRKEEYAEKARIQGEMANVLKEQLAEDEHLYDFSTLIVDDRDMLRGWYQETYGDKVFWYGSLSTNMAIGCGVGLYLLTILNVILDASLQLKYRANRKAVRNIGNDLVLFCGEDKKKEFEESLTKCSKKNDYDGFYQAIDLANSSIASASDPYSFKSEIELKTKSKALAASMKDYMGSEYAKEWRREVNEARKSRDLEKLNTLLEEGSGNLKEKVASPNTEGGPLTKAGASSYNATVVSNFFYRKWIGFVGNFIFSILTLGYAKLWADCAAQRYLADHTIIDGRHIEFDGKPMQLFGHNLKVKVLNILTLTIYGRIKKFSLKSWVCKHTKIEGYASEEKGKFNGSTFAAFMQKWVYLLLNILTLGIFSPFFVVSRQKYLAKHTYYQGVRLKFTGSAGSYYKTHIICWLLNLATLGIYSPWASLKKAKWVGENTHFDLKF